MIKDEAIKIIKGENLKVYNFLDINIKADEVGIQFVDGEWIVYWTDEKANYRIIKKYECEEEAISHVIECLRINKRLEERRKRRTR